MKTRLLLLLTQIQTIHSSPRCVLPGLIIMSKDPSSAVTSDPIAARITNDGSTETQESSSSSSNSSSSWFSFLNDKWTALVDEERMERLEHCRDLEQLLRDCQNGAQKQQLEDIVPMGPRMVHYFHWKQPTATTDDGNAEDVSDHVVAKQCVREVHAVWGCRALALQCGPDLVQLRKCALSDPRAILQESQTAYQEPIVHNSSSNSSEMHDKGNNQNSTATVIPCALQQQTLGKCVTQNAGELLQRQQQRKQQS